MGGGQGERRGDGGRREEVVSRDRVECVVTPNMSAIDITSLLHHSYRLLSLLQHSYRLTKFTSWL